MIRNLAKCGYANLKEFDFPHKRAMLGMLLRERFFAERLWVPRDVIATSPFPHLFPEDIAMQIHDLIGIGFGPSNIALAITLEEKKTGRIRRRLLLYRETAKFRLACQHDAGQHAYADFLPEGSGNHAKSFQPFYVYQLPASETKAAGLHQPENLFPSRHEFNDYLEWAAAHFNDRCAYGEEVLEVLPEKRNDEVTLLRIRSRDADNGHP